MRKILKNYSILLFSALIFIASSPLVVSGKSAWPAGPFGFIVGEDTFEEVKGRLKRYGCDIGTSSMTSGKAAVCGSKRLNADWLQGDVLFIFNSDDVLDAVSMSVLDSRTTEIWTNLESKYSLIQKQGYLLIFNSGFNYDTIIALDLDYKELSYYTKSFEQKYLNIKNSNKIEKEARQKAQF